MGTEAFTRKKATSETETVTGPVDAEEARWLRLARRVFVAASAIDLAFLAAYLFAVFAGYSGTHVFEIVDMNLESNPPAWWSSTQLLLIALTFLALATPLFDSVPTVRQFRMLWIGLAGAFVYLSLDEGGELHERMGHFLARLGFPTFSHGGAWVVPYLIVGSVGLLLLSRQIVRAWSVWRPQVLTFGAGFMTIVVAGGLVELASYVLFRGRYQHLGEVGIEEFFEMAGATIALFAPLSILARACAQLTSRLAGETSAKSEEAERPVESA